MQIEETSAQIETAQEKMRQEAEAEKLRQAKEKPQGFEFHYMDIADPKLFPNFKTKEHQDKFF